MKRFKFSGTIKITYEYRIVDETIEVEDDEGEADAIDAICEDLDPSESIDCEYDLFSLDVEELDENDEDITALRQRDRARLLAWNSGEPIRGTS